MMRIVFFLIALLFPALKAAPVFAGCTSPAGVEGQTIYNTDYHVPQYCNGTYWISFGSIDPAAGGPGCASPGAEEGRILYNSSYHVLQFCNGTSWMQVGASAGGIITVTPPSGNGYFVWSKATHNGNFSGSRANADSWCLSQLTANMGWKGYATANANGQLVAGKVHAYICDDVACNRLKQSTTYYFANANDASAGGASFTTDAMGYGPNDANNWSGLTFFNTSANWWSMAGESNSNTVDPRVVEPSGNSGGGLTGSGNGEYAVTNATNYTRWDKGLQASTTAYHLICTVDP